MHNFIRNYYIRTLLLVFLFLLPLSSTFAQSASPRRFGDAFTLKVALIGPGDELYFWWGHIGLVVEDSRTNQSRFYDWGVFSFDNENFFANFAFGRLIYSCAVSWAETYYNVYKRTNRSITLYTLDLPAESKEAIIILAENNILPENRDYSYHHFEDNCATRIRDILDMAVGGQFRAEFGEAPGRYTLRQHVRRHTWFHPFFDWILSFWMGQNIDKPITVWQEMFLPSEIAMQISDFHYTAPDGSQRPLVSSVETINASVGRPLVRDVPISPWPGALFFSLLFCELLLLLYLIWGRRKGFKPFVGIVNSFLGLFFGLAGSMLFFLMFLTNHDYTFNNINIVFVNPLLLAATPLGLIYAFTASARKRILSARLLQILWAYVFLGAIFTIVIRFFPAFLQQNQVTQALIIPIAVTMVFIMTRQRRLAAWN